MATLRPFAAVRYSRSRGFDLSNLIAPPYDVIAGQTKAELLKKDEHNVVEIDLPHLPAKSVGPDEAYQRSADTLSFWLETGVLERDRRPAIYPYTQTYAFNGKTYHRRGLIALVRLSPFGQGQVVPHEQTYPDAIADRLKLTQATGMQLSPIFGLFSDPRHEVTRALYENLGRPETSATLGGVKNDVWSVIDSDTENKVIAALGHKPIYIADGHHRYTMALEYRRQAAAGQPGGVLPPAHPANFCMFVLVGMQDDGLIVLPTHRLVGNVPAFDVGAFRKEVAGTFDVVETPLRPDHIDEFCNNVLATAPAHTMGLYDGRARKLYQLNCLNQDVLKPLEPDHSDAWRRLDVAILQRYLLDEVIGPTFAGGKDKLTKGYTADPFEVAPRTDGAKYQLALLLKSTPLGALEQLGRHNEVMPPKSTYFYPKLATGLVMYPVR